MKTLAKPDQRNINLFFGKRNQTTLQKFDSLSDQLRRSRTGTLDYLITHYEWFQNNRSEVVKWNRSKSVLLSTRCCRSCPKKRGWNQTSSLRCWFKRNTLASVASLGFTDQMTRATARACDPIQGSWGHLQDWRSCLVGSQIFFWQEWINGPEDSFHCFSTR